MGLAPKQRDRLTTRNKWFAGLVPVPLSRRTSGVRRGPRGKGTGTVPLPLTDISGLGGHGASPLSRSRFQFEVGN